MTIDRDGKRKIANFEIPETVVTTKWIEKPINYLNHPEIYNYGGFASMVIEKLSTKYRHTRLSTISKTLGYGFGTLNIINAYSQWENNEISSAYFTWDVTSTEATTIPKISGPASCITFIVNYISRIYGWNV